MPATIIPQESQNDMSPERQVSTLTGLPTGTEPITNNRPTEFTRTEYAERIAGEWRRGVISIIEVGQLLNSAKQTLPHTVYNEMIADDLPFPSSTTSMLRRVATRFDGVLYTEKLPPSWMTLYLLTRLPPVEFDRRLADGSINPAVAQREVRAWIKECTAGNRKQLAPADDCGSEGSPVQEQCAQREDAIESSQQEPIPSAEPAETHSAGNSGSPKEEADSASTAPVECPEPQAAQRKNPVDSCQKGQIASEDQLETRAAVNSDRPKGEVDSPSIAPDGVPDPQKLNLGVSAADLADDEALRAVKAVWCQASARARGRISAFVMKATIEQRGKAVD
jgi:hypothetical protein